jgi:hypothetical protein
MMNKNGEKSVARMIALEEVFLHPKMQELFPASYVKLLEVKGRFTMLAPRESVAWTLRASTCKCSRTSSLAFRPSK